MGERGRVVGMGGRTMTVSKLDKHLAAAGRLATVIDELGFDCCQRDVLAWCADVNVILDSDTKLPLEAFEAVKA